MRKGHILTGACLAALAFSVSSPAMAQQAQPAASQPADGQDIVVTATRREESLQTVPLAVTAISSQQLEARGINSLTNMQAQVTPGLIVQDFSGGATNLTFQMRGIVAPEPSTGLTEQGVSLYVDGVPIGRSVGAGIEVADIERIEVLRGPQGTLFGRNAEGGAVQYVTKKPTGVLGGSIVGEYGNFNQRRVQGNVNLPAFHGIAVKLSGLWTAHDGWVKNAPLRAFDAMPATTPRNDFAQFEQAAFRVDVLWELSPDMKARYTFDYADTDYTNDYMLRTGNRAPSIPAFCAPGPFAALCADPATLAANIYTGTRPADVNGRPDVSNLPMYLPVDRNRARGHNLTLDLTASDTLSFRSITAYRTMKEDQANNTGDLLPFVQFVPTSAFAATALAAPAQPLAVSGNISPANVDQNQFSQELQAFYNSDRFSLTAGLFYYHERVLDFRDSLFGNLYFYNPATAGLTAVVAAPFPLQTNATTGLSAAAQKFRGVANSYAAYAQGTYTPPVLDDRLKFTVGLRYTHDKKEFTRLLFGGAPDGNTRSVFDAQRVDPAITLAMQVTPDINAYVKYSSGYRAGGVNIRNAVGLDPYNAEVNKAFEAGLKMNLFDRRVRWNMAAYRSKVTGAQISVFNSPLNTTSQTTINVDGIKIWGIESELAIRPVEGLTLSASYAYMHVDSPATITAFGKTYNYTPPYAPKHQLMLAGDYSVPVMNDMKLALHADYNYQSDTSVTGLLPPNPLTKEPIKRLHITNARLALQDIPVGTARAEIALFGKNVFDVKDYGFTFAVAASDPTQAAQPGGYAYNTAPRTYGVQVRLTF